MTLSLELVEPTSVTEEELDLCADRSIGHTWREPENRHWTDGLPLRRGRRTITTIWAVAICTRCGSHHIEVFGVDHRRHLLPKMGNRYRYTKAYKQRNQLLPDQRRYRNWQRATGR